MQDNYYGTASKPVIATVEFEDFEENVADWLNEWLYLSILECIEFRLSFCNTYWILADGGWDGIQLARCGGQQVLASNRQLVKDWYVP
jgi:hypothetical protein